ncbi:hypothetical protein ACFVUW_05585 [Streptomyces xiamenensis]|uniref:hypothetical protein n=1 Tax=Streptomyces xiamenensis TaxID=408015 RepID=UPI0036E32CF1
MNGVWVRAVEIAADTVMVGDVIAVGGRQLMVADLVSVPGGRRLRFASGEVLMLHQHSRLTATRSGPYRRRKR